MRLSRLFLSMPLAALAALLLAPAPVVRADDTEDFLKPENWEGRSDIWTLDPKTKTVVGETKQDPKYNTFFCSKKKYSDFELTCKVELCFPVSWMPTGTSWEEDCRPWLPTFWHRQMEM